MFLFQPHLIWYLTIYFLNKTDIVIKLLITGFNLVFQGILRMARTHPLIKICYLFGIMSKETSKCIAEIRCRFVHLLLMLL